MEKDKKKDKKKELIRMIARHNGYKNQSRTCIYVMEQLHFAMNEYWRTDLKNGDYLNDLSGDSMPNGSEEYQELVNEIAEVQMMLEMMKFWLNTDRYVEKLVEKRLETEAKQIANMKGESGYDKKGIS